jgi:hypothetical protein
MGKQWYYYLGIIILVLLFLKHLTQLITAGGSSALHGCRSLAPATSGMSSPCVARVPLGDPPHQRKNGNQPILLSHLTYKFPKGSQPFQLCDTRASVV